MWRAVTLNRWMKIGLPGMIFEVQAEEVRMRAMGIFRERPW